MTVSNLFHVTETLISLLEKNIPRVISGGAINVMSRPPEALGGASRALNVFLYHVAEDPNYKNQPPPGNGPRPVATTPMALILYFIVTAHHENQSQFDASVEQELMGGALKTLHDHPFIDAGTEIPEAGPVMNPNTIGATGSALEVSLRPVTPEEALSFWSSEQSQTARLSAYYEVRAVFLEPEAPTTYPGTVQSVGSYVFPINAPVLTGSRSTVSVEPPAATGLPPASLPASPARPFALTAAEAAAGTAADFVLTGSSLSAGRRQRLVLRHPDFARLSPPRRQIPVDAELNAVNGWSVGFGTDTVEVTFGAALSFVGEDGSQTTIPLYPGSYLVSVETEIGAYEVGTRRRPILERSNEVTVLRGAYLTGPRGPAPLGPNGEFDLSVSPAFDLARDNGDELRELDIVLVVAGTAYRRVLNAGALAESGQFFVTTTPEAVPGPDGLTRYSAATVTARAAFDPLGAAAHPVRLIVEGVDAQPFWLEV